MSTPRHPWATYGLIMAGGYCAFRMLRTAVRTQNLRGKIVLITGGTQGLGMILARDFALAGARVAICARGVDELEKARSWIHKEAAAAILAVPGDVSQRADVDRMVKHIHRVYGPIDILVNNAGTSWEACNVDDFEKTQTKRFWGMLYPTLAVLPSMQEKRSGQIVNMTTILPGLIRIGPPPSTPPFRSRSAERSARKIMKAVVNGYAVRNFDFPEAWFSFTTVPSGAEHSQN